MPAVALEDRVVQSERELHVGIDIPRHAAKQIHRWAMKQQWPEGSELEHPSEYHITLLYTPEGYKQHKDAWWLEHLEHAEVSTVGVKAFPAQEKGYAYVLVVESPEIQQKAEEMQGRAEWAGLPVTHFDGGYKPHITVAYGPTNRLTGIKPPEFLFGAGPSSVSPPRPKESRKAPEPPKYRPASSAKHCGSCKMFDHTNKTCWGYGNKQVKSGYVCDSWTQDSYYAAYNPDEVKVLDHLSLNSVAHNLHYRFQEGGMDPSTATDYAKQLLQLIGYPTDDITVQAALQAWQQNYPADNILGPAEQSRALQASPDTPTESFPTYSGSEKIVVPNEELSQGVSQPQNWPFKRIVPDSTVPTQVEDPEDRWPDFGEVPQDKKRDVEFSNDWNFRSTKRSVIVK